MLRVPKNLRNSVGPLGRLLMVIGAVLIVPVLVGLYFSEWAYKGFNIYLGYLIPAVSALVVGFILDRKFESTDLTLVQGLILTGFAWIVISFFCSIPFLLIMDMGVVNAYFEAVSGFTTTGITMITNLNPTVPIPKSLIFWRSLIQWIGGLGIITFFLFIGRKGISEHILFRGESHKIKASKPVPNVMRTIKYLWVIFTGFTVVLMTLLWLEGLSPFDAVTHALTTLSTGGFSPYNASIEYFRIHQTIYPHFRLIEYTIVIFMIIGGTNFVVHYQALKGRIQSLWDNMEVKMWWAILGISTFLIMWETGIFENQIEPLFRNTIFQVVSVATTTGFQTEFIGNKALFGPFARQLFLVLMVIGGCVSSTGGGIKVRRVGIMLKGIWNRIKRASRPREMLTPLKVDGDRVEDSDLERVFIIFITWIFILVIGGFLTALLSGHEPLTSFSGIFSALGNIGPSYFSVAEMAALSPLIKIFYIFAMLVGRLEILPIFVLFNREVWKE